MWGVVLWLSVVAATEAFEEPYTEYLYSRKDGQVLIEPIASDAPNKTIYIRSDDPELLQNETMQYLRQLTQTRNPRFQRWTSSNIRKVHGNFDARIPKRRSKKNCLHQKRLRGTGRPAKHGKHMKLHGSHIRKDPQLDKLQDLVKPAEVNKCTEGAMKFYECNHCVCMGGQLYVCTARECEPGSKNRLIAFEKDVNCIEGEQIRSFDACNRCYCAGGKIVCSRKSCPHMKPADHQDNPRCKPGTNIPSPDTCNICACNTKGNIVCTVRSCGPEISPQIKDIGCKPNTWYSLEVHSRCKECYCINGKMSFCYVNLCVPPAMKHQTLSNKVKPMKSKELSLPGALPDHCAVDDYMQDTCTYCYCTSKGIWSCRTREMKVCGKPVEHDDDHTTKKPRKRTTGTGSRKRTRTRTTTPSNSHHIPNNHDEEETTETPTPFIFDKTKYPFEDNDFTSARTTTTRYTLFPDYSQGSTAPSFIDPVSYEDGRGPDFDNGHGPDFDNGNQDFPYTEEPEVSYSSSTAFPERDTFDICEYYDVDEEPFVPFDVNPDYGDREPNSPEDFTKPDHTTKRPDDFDSNNYGGPFCINGQYFTQGSDTHCQGCFCNTDNEWKCYSIKGACRDHPEKSCNSGKLRKTQNPCTVCYCGIDNKSYCATDETCSYSIKPSACEITSCLRHCMGSGASFGVCHKENCVCVN